MDNSLLLQKPEYTITGYVYGQKGQSVIDVCYSHSEMTAKVNGILANRETYGQYWDYITITDALDDHVATHELNAKRTAPMGNIIINSDTDMELTIYASHCGRLIKSQAHNTAVALALAYNYQQLGWDVEIDSTYDWNVLFDSDYDIIQEQADGSLKALYIVGAR